MVAGGIDRRQTIRLLRLGIASRKLTSFTVFLRRNLRPRHDPGAQLPVVLSADEVAKRTFARSAVEKKSASTQPGQAYQLTVHGRAPGGPFLTRPR
jgi:hypothetical protein